MTTLEIFPEKGSTLSKNFSLKSFIIKRNLYKRCITLGLSFEPKIDRKRTRRRYNLNYGGTYDILSFLLSFSVSLSLLFR